MGRRQFPTYANLQYTSIQADMNFPQTAPRQSSEKLFSFYPGLEKKITVDEWIDERNSLHEEAFKRVRPLPGALSLVKRLSEARVPIAIATGSNTNNFRWKTVGHSSEPNTQCLSISKMSVRTLTYGGIVTSARIVLALSARPNIHGRFQGGIKGETTS